MKPNATKQLPIDQPTRPPQWGPSPRGVNMFARSLSIIALTAVVSAAAATQAVACCGCAYTCAPPAQVQIWGLSPAYVVNQGPVFSGPGYYTAPTYEVETLTSDYPYVGYGGFPRYPPPDDGRLSGPLRPPALP